MIANGQGAFTARWLDSGQAFVLSALHAEFSVYQGPNGAPAGHAEGAAVELAGLLRQAWASGRRVTLDIMPDGRVDTVAVVPGAGC